jgi:hypothetical protein
MPAMNLSVVGLPGEDARVLALAHGYERGRGGSSRRREGVTMPLQLRSPGYASSQLLTSVERILSTTALCSMATTSEAGTVDINTAFFAVGSDLLLYFLSHPNAAHSRNLIGLRWR